MYTFVGIEPEAILFGGQMVEQVRFAGVTVWGGSGWDWEETFTSPTIPPGWEPMVDGVEYSPPGFRGHFVGPHLGGDFEVEVDLPDPPPAFWVGVFDPAHLGTQDPFWGIGPHMQYGSQGQGARLLDTYGGNLNWESQAHGLRFMLRRQGDVYTVLKDGTPVERSGGGILQRTLPGWDDSRILVAGWDAATGALTNYVEAVRYRAI